MNICVNEEKIKKKLEQLASQIHDMDIYDQYDELRRTVAERFIRYGMEDVQQAQYERAVYTINCLEELLNRESNHIKGKSYQYHTHKAEIDGFSMLDTDGHPVFYIGYGHFEGVKRDIPNLSKFGSNTIQIEIGPNSVLFQKGMHEKWELDNTEYFKEGETFCYTDGEFEVYLSAIVKDLIPVLENAEKHNQAVSLLISPHYLPHWMYEKYPEIRSNTPGFFGYNIYHPIIEKMLRVYVNALIPRIKDYPSLQSIIISNEPMFDTSADQGTDVQKHDVLPTEQDTSKSYGNTIELWREYLSEKFGTVENMNSLLGTNAKSFREVTMPSYDEKTPIFYEWTLWNNKMFYEWHKHLADMVHEIAPDIPVGSKFAPVFGTSEMPYHRRFITYGVDPEEFMQFSDLGFNDAWSFLGRNHIPMTYKFMWYDYLGSIKKIPLDDAEDHVIEDRDENFSYLQAKRIYTDMWLGAIHGRTLSQLWLWERTNDSRSEAYGSILQRPDCIEAAGRASLDLNRLAEKVTVLQNKKPKIAILYSKPSRIYDTEFIPAFFKAYEASVFAGHRVHFVHEDVIGQIFDYPLLIVPNVTATDRHVKDTIAEYAKKNGKVLLIDRGGMSLTRNEYNKPDGFVLEGAQIVADDLSGISPCEEYTEKLAEIIEKLLPQKISLKTDKKYNYEWFAAETDGKTMVSICNHNEEEKRVSILSGNQPIRAKNLITEKDMEEIFVIPPCSCVLAEF